MMPVHQARIRGRRGATLMEMMVAVTILFLLGGVLLTLVDGSLRSWSTGASAAYADSSASIAVQKLAYEVRDGASASISGETLTVTFPATISDATSGETLYTPGGVGQTRQYLLSSGNLIRRIGGVDTILARGVSSVTFSATLGVVTATIRTQEQVGRATTERASSARITLRNHAST